MRLKVLHVPDCPNTAVMRARLQQLLTGHPDVVIEDRVIRSEGGAAARGMTGSPTLLIDGVDPFAAPGLAPSMSCRLYVDEGGALSGAPSIAQLRTALSAAANR
jgi:hypothetical protein